MFDENSVAERVLSGDDAAFGRLVDLYIQRVYLYTLYYLGQEDDAQKASVEIFCQVYRKLDSLRDDQLLTWVMRIAAEVCAEHQRHRRGAASRVTDAEDDPLEIALCQQMVLLQRQQREILLLHDVCGLSDEKVARVLKLDVNGVRLRLSRARKNLRDQLLRAKALERPKPQRGRNNGKDCTQYRELCSRYVDEYISDEDKQVLLEHIQECTACAAYLNDLTLIGRSLAHMEQRMPPKQLRERILQAARQQTQNQVHWKRMFRLPLVLFFVFSVMVLLLIASGAAGGLFINSSGIIDDSYTEGLEKQDEYTVREELDIPDNVNSSSYAFVIAASGGTQLPEFSEAANLIASSTDKTAAYYSVNNDIAQVQKLTEVLQSLGYRLESVNNRQLVISGSAQKGLLIIINGSNSGEDQAKIGSAAAE